MASVGVEPGGSGDPAPPSPTAAREKVRVETVTVGEVEAWVRRFFAEGARQVTAPLSEERAAAWARNPHADPGDPALLVAWVGERCVGYQGILPLPFRDGDRTTTIYWGSAAYVLPEYRNRLVTLHLVRALLGFRKDVALSGFNDVVLDVYRGLGFVPVEPVPFPLFTPARLNLLGGVALRVGRRGPEGSVRDRLSRFLERWSRRWLYPPLRAAYGSWLGRWAGRRLRRVPHRVVDRIREPGDGERRGAGDRRAHFPRDAALVNWMLAHPWIRSGGGPSVPPYHFADFRDRFAFHAVEIPGEGDRPRGWVVFSVQEQRGERMLRVTDLWGEGEEERRAAAWVVLRHAARHRVDRVEGLPGMEGALAEAPLARLLLHRDIRRYLFRPGSPDSPLQGALARLELHPSDGDCPYT